MGASLSTRAEWTSAAGGTGSSGKLEFSKQNESLLIDLARYVQHLVSGHQREADVVFKRPFQWKSRLSASDFQQLTSGEDYNLVDNVVTSVGVTNSGEPILKLTHVGSGSEIKAWSFRQLAQVLNCAGDRKLQEVQACLESNRDPVANIMGQAYASAGGAADASRALLETHERLSRERMRDGVGADTVDELDNSFRLLILLSSMDVQLLQSSVKEIGKEVRLNPSAVENEVNLLKEFTGYDTYSCLNSVEFTSKFVFDNGCHSAPWRQVQGDIAYLQIKPCDGDTIYVTASTFGYYVIKGLESGGQMNHEQVGKVYPTLVTLLKTQSHHFAQNIEKQEFTYRSGEDHADQGRASDDVDARPSVPVEVIEQDTKQTTEKSKAQSQVKAKKTDYKTKAKKGAVTSSLGPRSSEPTQKWKNLTAGPEIREMKIKPLDIPVAVSKGRARTRTGGSSHYSGTRSRRSLQEVSMLSDSSSEDEEEEVSERRQETGDLPTEYWQIQKLVRYLKAGNQTATVIALCSIRDFDLSQETCQVAIRDVGGLEVLINLLETAEVKCKIGSLKILREVSKNPLIRTSVADLGGLETMVSILQATNKELKCLAAETIANVAKFKRARRTVRQHGGISKLVALLQCDVITDPKSAEEELNVAVARSGALALWSCSKSKKNREAIQKAGAVPLLAKLLKSNTNSVLIPVVGTLQECASEPSYRELIRSQGMIEDLVRNLSSESQELQMHCASAIFKCAEDEEMRMLVHQYGGLDPLVQLLSATANKELLAAATGAIWKCAVSIENVERFQQLKAIEQLVGLLHGQPEEVLINVVGALGECAKESANRTTVRKSGGIGPLVSLLTGTNQALLINVTRAVGACAQDNECMTIIDQNDGVRLLWSLLKSPNPEVQASAAWAICPCIENAKDAGEMVRSFVGGLELIVSLLRSDDREVLASVCAAIGNIAKDEENLAVITDHGVVPMLAKLTHTTDDHLRKHLSEAIARCCMWGNNRVAFGTNGAVAPLVKYLQSPSEDVHRATARALYQLSRDPNNCITMHDSLVVKPLLKMIGSTDEVLQEASAGCIANIRRLALANEKAKYG